ncbi:three-helix bundle dimerization domain-containing protein [Streptomyces decoyicus]
MRAQQDELTAVHNVATRLQSAYPSVDPAAVDALVKTAYEQLHQARIRTYIPILVERRARSMLNASSRDSTP